MCFTSHCEIRMPDEIQKTLGRIEEKVDGLCDRIDRQGQAIYGSGGIEPRLRFVEQDMAVIKTKAGVVSAAVSTIIMVLGWLLPWVFKK